MAGKVKKQTHRVHRLDDLLRIWEAAARYRRANKRNMAAMGMRSSSEIPTDRHAEDLREHMLSLRALHGFDMTRFLYDFSDPRFTINDGSPTKKSVEGYIPLELAAWTARSRRVFHLTDRVAGLIQDTSFTNVCWKDVQFPFESFAVTFETPIRYGEHWDFDCLLFTRVKVQELSGIDRKTMERFLPLLRKVSWLSPSKRIKQLIDNLLNHENLTLIRTLSTRTSSLAGRQASEALSFERAVAKGQKAGSDKMWEQKRQRLGNEATNRLDRLISSDAPHEEFEAAWRAAHAAAREADPPSKKQNIPISVLSNFGAGTVDSTIASLDPDVWDDVSRERTEKALKLLAGLSLYIQALNANRTDVRPLQWREAPARRRVGARVASISDESQICDVTSHHFFPDGNVPPARGEREAAPRQRGERNRPVPHWQRAYFRRRPGFGRDPNAPKVVYVKASKLKNADLLPDRGLPGGSKTDV